MSAPRRLVIAITGASGAIFGIRALELLREVADVETHVVVTRGARRTILEETDHTVAEVCALADHVHAEHDLGAAVSSGSFRTEGMLVAPCSIKTLSAIVNCYADNLVVRAADVTLKEGRKLVLLVRETPMHKGHLRLLLSAAENGATIMPPVPAFYHRPDSIAALVDQTVGRALDQFGFDLDIVRRWREPETTSKEQVSL